MDDPRHTAPTPPSTHGLRRRLGWLLACLAGGAAVGAIGHALTGQPWWYASITVALAAGWIALADPTRCTRPDGPPH